MTFTDYLKSVDVEKKCCPVCGGFDESKIWLWSYNMFEGSIYMNACSTCDVRWVADDNSQHWKAYGSYGTFSAFFPRQTEENQTSPSSFYVINIERGSEMNIKKQEHEMIEENTFLHTHVDCAEILAEQIYDLLLRLSGDLRMYDEVSADTRPGIGSLKSNVKRTVRLLSDSKKILAGLIDEVCCDS